MNLKMSNIVTSSAFLPHPSSYDETLTNLVLVEGRVPLRIAAYESSTSIILFSHGNASDLGDYNIQELANCWKISIAIYDYAGYGIHTNKQYSESSCYDDITTVYSYLTLTLRIPSENIILYGQSLGTGPTCYLADLVSRNINPVTMKKDENVQVMGIILHSPLKSAIQVVLRPGIAWLLSMIDIFRNCDRVPSFTFPTLLIHGNADQVINYEHSEALWGMLPDKARYRFVTIYGGYHNDLEKYPEFHQEIVEFHLHLASQRNNFR